MKNEKFDHLLAEIRNQQLDEKIVAQAGERVWKSISAAPSNADLSPHTLRSCEDFQTLIPGYLASELAPARALLFDDHVHACVACRHALERARDGRTADALARLRRSGPASTAWRWALGAAAGFAVAIRRGGSLSATDCLSRPASGSRRGSDGGRVALYRVRCGYAADSGGI